MRITKIASESNKEDDQKMKDWFEKRTKSHIARVQKFCKKIADYKDDFKELIERGEVHDKSKFEDPEIDPYVYIAWKYKCQDDGIDYEPPKGLDEKMNKATEHHVKNNKHHPEYHCEKEVDLINREDRDKPPEELIDATKMYAIDIAEMVADWCAMSDEKGGNPKDWADNNVNVRWKFNDKQSYLIYELIDAVWE